MGRGELREGHNSTHWPTTGHSLSLPPSSLLKQKLLLVFFLPSISDSSDIQEARIGGVAKELEEILHGCSPLAAGNFFLANQRLILYHMRTMVMEFGSCSSRSCCCSSSSLCLVLGACCALFDETMISPASFRSSWVLFFLYIRRVDLCIPSSASISSI